MLKNLSDPEYEQAFIRLVIGILIFFYWVKGDSIRIRQIITNLISNAIKFTEQGGITIKAKITAEGIWWNRLRLSPRKYPSTLVIKLNRGF